ncbi:MAG: hypothetical protein H0T46_15385 [Deltaproteobacteria bacterium]|nr:hypothetical protein [Deltaproteobacteria bacterium]
MLKTAAFVVASLAMLGSAAADRLSYHGTVSADAAVTDNVLSVPLGSDNREGDILLTIRPGMLFTYGIPRFINEFNAELEMTRYGAQTDQPTIATRAGWKAIILTGPLSEVILQADVSRSVVSAIGAAAIPTETMVTLLPINQVTAMSGGANEYASKVLTRELRLFQTAFARASKSDDEGTPPTRIDAGEVGASLGLDRSFIKNAVSLEVGVSVLNLHRNPEAPMGGRDDEQVNLRGRIQWRRDFTRKLSGSADAGAVLVMPYGTDMYHPFVEKNNRVFPLLGVSGHYTDVWGIATAFIRRDVTPNLFVGANTVNDTAAVVAAMPLYLKAVDNNRRAQPKLAGVGSFGLQRTQLIEESTSDLQSSFWIARIDAGIQYAPRPGFTYQLRYEMMYQTADRGQGVVDPLPGFLRNTIYVSASARFPADVAVRVPKRRTNAVRADRKDLAPIGVEPVIPDLTEGAGDGE